MLKSRHPQYDRLSGLTGKLRRGFDRRHTVDIIAGAILVAAVAYLALFFARVNAGLSRTLDRSSDEIRLQVVNGAAEDRWLDRLADNLASWGDTDLAVRVVAVDDFGIRDVPHTMVISRVEDQDMARLLAERLGLDPADVFYRPLEHNRGHATVTLLLGEDYERLTVDALLEKETAR